MQSGRLDFNQNIHLRLKWPANACSAPPAAPKRSSVALRH